MKGARGAGSPRRRAADGFRDVTGERSWRQAHVDTALPGGLLHAGTSHSWSLGYTEPLRLGFCKEENTTHNQLALVCLIGVLFCFYMMDHILGCRLLLYFPLLHSHSSCYSKSLQMSPFNDCGLGTRWQPGSPVAWWGASPGVGGSQPS